MICLYKFECIHNSYTHTYNEGQNVSPTPKHVRLTDADIENINHGN